MGSIKAKVVLVAGTNSWDGRSDTKDWYCPGSPFNLYLQDQQIEAIFPLVYDRYREPFIWSTDLGGVPFLSRNKLLDWKAGGAALFYFVTAFAKLAGTDTNIICHSHGLQVVLFACAVHGLKVRNLVSLGSPIRKDMMPNATLARPNITWWTHVYSDESDRWQWFGELFDGHLGIVRKHPLADLNLWVPKVGHSELLRDPTTFGWWTNHMKELL